MLAIAVALSVAGTIGAQENPAASDAAQANNPLANFTAFNIHDYYIGEFTDTDRDGNQAWARYARPFSIGEAKWLMRAPLPVNTLFNFGSPKLQYGYLLSWQASFAVADDRDDVNVGAFQPFVFYQLGHGNYLRSTEVMVYDFEHDTHSVPIGLGGGRARDSSTEGDIQSVRRATGIGCG